MKINLASDHDWLMECKQNRDYYGINFIMN